MTPRAKQAESHVVRKSESRLQRDAERKSLKNNKHLITQDDDEDLNTVRSNSRMVNPDGVTDANYGYGASTHKSMKSSKTNMKALLNMFPAVSKDAIIDKTMLPHDVEHRLNIQNDPIRKKVEHDIAPDLDLASGMFVDENERNLGVQNIMTLFSD